MSYPVPVTVLVFSNALYTRTQKQCLFMKCSHKIDFMCTRRIYNSVANNFVNDSTYNKAPVLCLIYIYMFQVDMRKVHPQISDLF